MKRTLLFVSVPLAAAFAAVACMSVDDTPGVTIDTPPPSGEATADAAQAPPGSDSGGEDACASHREDGATLAGCCLPTGRCGYYVPSLNACTDPVQLGLERSGATCTYDGTDDEDGDDEDKDKDKDKD
ncbi:MAG: hypothetical protein KF850_42495, partial [Labilithrix sp.]|nr:hypothetical protein [Labilithrix sp.]